MKHFFTLLLTIIAFGTFGQTSNLIVFNNSGQQFFVILNGIKQNSLPKTNVKIEGLAPAAYKVKIIFADGRTGDIDKSVFLESSMEYSAQIVLKKGKKGKLRLFDMVALNTSPYGNGAEIITYRPTDNSVYSDQQNGSAQGNVQINTTGKETNGASNGSVQISTNGTQTSNQTSTSQSSQVVTTTVNGQTTTVTTHTHANGTVHDQNHQPVSTSGTVVVNGTGTTIQGSTLTHADGTVHDQNHKPIQQPTTNTNPAMNGTHTHADGTVHDHNHKPVKNPTTNTNPAMNGTHTHADGTVHDHNHNVVNPPVTKPTAGSIGQATVNADGTLTCSSALPSVDYIIEGIKVATYSSDQVNFVQKSLEKACINSDQAYRIVNTFTFDGDKIKIAKFCFDHMTDKQSAHKLLSLFQFSSSKDELKKYFGI